MGTWGTEPKDNDSTWDLWGHCCDAINAVVSACRGRDTQDCFERAGLVQLLLEKGVHVRYWLVEQAAADLRAALADEEWLAQWKSPKATVKTVTRIAAAMEALLTREKENTIRVKFRQSARTRLRFQEVLAWNGWPGPEKGSWTGIETKAKKPKKRQLRQKKSR